MAPSSIAALGVMLAALPACLAARTAGEVAHYAMSYQDCTSTCSDAVPCEVDGKNKFTEWVAQGKAAALGQAGAKPSASYNLAEWRSLRKGAGAECQPEHLGAKLDVTAAYSPLESALPSDSPAQTAPAIATANFAGDIVDGWTLELWLKPVPIPAGDTEDRVLVVLVASNPDSSSSNDLQLDCGKALDQVSFMLMMKPSGCHGTLKRIMSVRCLLFLPLLWLPIFGSGRTLGTGRSFVSSTSGCLYVVLKMTNDECGVVPSRPQCEGNDYNIGTGAPGIDTSSPKLQHVVVSFRSFIGTDDIALKIPRFAFYVDTELKAADTTSVFAPGGLPGGLRSGNGQNFVPSALWPENHVLRVGFDATGDTTSRWEGDIFMIAMYGKPLTAAEVEANFAAGLDNSAPAARDGSHTLEEDACSQLPAFDYTDWDNTNRPDLGLGSTGQTLTFRVDRNTLTGGALYTDSSCTQLLDVDVIDGQLWFKPAADEFQPAFTNSGASYSSFEWSITDDGTPPGTDTATLYLNVTAVNDPPVASDSKLGAFMGLATRIYLNGSDVDGDGPEQPCTSTAAPTSGNPPHTGMIGCGKIRNARVRITQMPSKGKLFEVASGGSEGVELEVGFVMRENGWGRLNKDPDNANPSVYYVSELLPTTGKDIVASDSFRFSLIDTDDAESTESGTVSINILSGLDAISLDNTVNEEEPTVLQLRGYNAREQPSAVGISTTFVLESLPSHGILYQYAAAAPYKGAPITADMLPVIVADEPWNDPANPQCCSETGVVDTCDGSTGGITYRYFCPRLVFEGELDWFSWPTQTRDGVALNEEDDRFSYHLTSTNEESETTKSESANISVRVRNVNDPPTLVLAANASFTPQQDNAGLLGSILSVIDADRGVGLYQVKLELSSVSGTLADGEKALRQPADEPASFEYYQWDSTFVEELIGYCPPVCGTSGSKCLKTGCLSGDGLGMKRWFFFVTPAKLPSILKMAEFFSQTDAGLTLSVEINDFDDGVCTASDSAACGSYLSDKGECKLLGGGRGFDSSSSSVGGSGVVSWLGMVVAIFAVVVAAIVLIRREFGRTARRDIRGNRRPHARRTREQRWILPIIATIGLVLQLLLFLGRSSFDPFTMYRMDFSGDGTCSDGIADAHAEGFAWVSGTAQPNTTGYEVNGECVAGVPKGFVSSRMLGDVLLVGLLLPLVLLECVGRPWGRVLVVFVGIFWFLFGLIRLAIFDFSTPKAESPWTDQGSGTIGKGDTTRPVQNNGAAAIVALAVLIPLAITLTAGCAMGLMKRRQAKRGGEESESSEDSEEDRKKIRKLKRKKTGGNKEKKSKAGRHKDERSDDDDSDDDSEDDEGSSKKKGSPPKRHKERRGKDDDKGSGKKAKRPPPSRKKANGGATELSGNSIPLPPSLLPAPTITFHNEVALNVQDMEEWFYMDDINEQKGPVSRAEIQTLFNDGVVYQDTYVWNETMDGWQPMREAMGTQASEFGGYL